jgi:hypothetical protein
MVFFANDKDAPETNTGVAANGYAQTCQRKCLTRTNSDFFSCAFAGSNISLCPQLILKSKGGWLSECSYAWRFMMLNVAPNAHLF